MKVKVSGDTAVVHWKGEIFQIIHIDDFGVLVVGESDRPKAIKLLGKLGYDTEEVEKWSWRPHMTNQVERAVGEFGSPYGGESAIAFYF